MAVFDSLSNTSILIIVIVVAILLGIIIYEYLLKKPTPSNTSNAVVPTTVGLQNRTCLTADAQKQIADTINAKLKEIDSCDCTQQCKVSTK
jgi:uncharacterized membrane protein AbrB (regulator of aidB expression)